MKIEANITCSASVMGRETFARFRVAFPDRLKSNSFWEFWGGDYESEEVRKVLAWLERNDVRPGSTIPSPPSRFTLYLDRVYSDEELQEFAWFTHESLFDDRLSGEICNDQFVGLYADSFEPPISFANVPGFRSFCASNDIRNSIEAAALRDVAFRVVRWLDEDVEPTRGPGFDVWQVTSVRTLPELLSPPTKLDRRFNRLSLRDGSFRNPELHYPAEKMKACRESDCAITSERFGLFKLPGTVFSSRFRDLLTYEGVAGRWYPVHLH